MPSRESQLLLRALQDRDLALSQDDFAWAFDGSLTRANAEGWVRNHIDPATLLTSDELRCYESRGIGNGHPGSEVAAGRPLSDIEIEAAIVSLEASTAAIEKQCKILESQKAALEEIQARGSSAEATAANELQEKRSARERAQLDFDIEDRAQVSTSTIRASIKQTETSTSNVPAQVDRLLEKDDRLLDGLQKILPRISDSSLDADDSAIVEQLCSALATLSVKEIRARLDKTYHQSLMHDAQQPNGSIGNDLSDQQKKQRDNLRIELEELSGEIEGLVSIVVDQQYRTPLKRGVLSAQAEVQAQKATWTEYTISALAYLTARLDALGDHVQQLHAHGAALRSISTTLDETLAAEQPTQKVQNNGNQTPTEKTNIRGLKPLRLVQANSANNQDPAIQFLRQQDIRVSETDSATKLAETLSSIMRERQSRLAILDKSTERIITNTVAKSLIRTEAEVEDLVCSVYSHSQHGQIQLTDQKVQAELDAFERETQRLGDAMRDLDIDAIAKSVNNKQAEIVQRLSGRT